MSPAGWLQIAAFFVVVLVLTKPLGLYIYNVMEGGKRPLARVERILFRLCGTEGKEQSWQSYAFSMLLFSLFGFAITYAIARLQAHLPLNPQHLPGVAPDLAFNTAVSFITNTNWQAYTPETTVSYLTNMTGLAWHNFTSAATGIAVAFALIRGLTRPPSATGSRTIGNFWADVIRSILYIFLPISILGALLLVSQGVIQNFAPYLDLTTLEGAKQTLALGPTASQEIIKELGTNGGGFFNANSAHPFENPNAISNFIEMVAIFAIPAALTYSYGRMARDHRQGWAIFTAMTVMFLIGVTTAYWAETQPNPALIGLAVDQSAGNLEGKEIRFGIVNSALFATITTDTSCGAVNAMHDSFTPLGGMVPLFDILLACIIFGGVGAGLYGMLAMVILSVFIAGLMVGRTPEYLGKKVEAKEVKLTMLHILVFPLLILVGAALSAVLPAGLAGIGNPGPHGLSQILYGFASTAANNGSAFAGLNANSLWYNSALGLAMLGGRFLMAIPLLAVAGSMAGKKIVPPGDGTFPTTGPLFIGLLIGVIVIVGALTFFPVLSLGPILEHIVAQGGRVF